jgi:dinuclear metal center YbgI/SA1388 family protein
MPIRVHDIVEALFARAPRELAEPWDNVGLIVGDPRSRVRRALVCVDATSRVLAEATRARAELVIAHHPPFIEALKRVRADEMDSAIIYRAARLGISICAMHTNLDYAPDGLCIELAQVVGLKDIHPLAPATGSPFVKLAVFVPPSYLDAVREAMAEAGAGRIGRYDECSFASAGEGTYRPTPGAIPYAGTVGRLERAPEARLEMIVPRSALPRVVHAMEAAHPYEQVAYDVYPLANPWPGSARGAVGVLRRAMTLRGFARRIKQALGITAARVAGGEHVDAASPHLRSGAQRRLVRVVAVASGSGGHVVGDACASGADVLLLGDIRHSDVLRALECGLSVIEAGHFATERPAVPLMCRWLAQDLGGRIEIIASRSEGDPFSG